MDTRTLRALQDVQWSVNPSVPTSTSYGKLFCADRIATCKPFLRKLPLQIHQSFISSFVSRRCFASTTAVRAPWWNENAAALNGLLWKPTTDTAVSFPIEGLQQSWFASRQVHSCPGFQHPLQSKYLAACKVPIGTPTVTRTVKIRILPNDAQRKVFNLAIEAYRVTRASCIRWISRHKALAKDLGKSKAPINPLLDLLRTQFVTATSAGETNRYFEDKQWMLTIAKEVRFSAVKDAVACLKANLTKVENGHNKRFRMRIKISASQATFGVEKKLVYQNGMLRFKFRKMFGACSASLDVLCNERHMPFTEVDDDGVQLPICDCKIHRARDGSFYLLAAYKVVKSAENFDSRPVIAGDMGVRKLITTYTSDGASHTLGERAGDRLLRLLDVRAKIQSILKKKALGRKAKRVLQKSDERYARKHVHLRDELHRKLTNWLTSNYSMIVLPKLNVKRLTSKEGTLCKKTKRTLLALGTSRFYERLAAKCATKQVLLINGEESYTSIGCDNCGYLNRQLGSSEIFCCSACGHRADRDVHSARGIMLKNCKLYSLV